MNSLKTSVILTILTVFTAGAIGAQQLSPIKRNGQLSVVKGKIVNQHQVPPQLRGISMSWSIWEGRKYYNQEVINWLRSDFKVNLIRLAMAVEPDHGYLKDPTRQYQLITSCIDHAIKDDIYVIVDWHDHHADRHLNQSKEFFVKIAKKYAGKPNIIYEVYNEPEKIDWSTVKNYATAVIKEIRKYDKDNLIIVGSPSWDQDVDAAAKDPILGFKNVAYSFHFYSSDQWHQEKLMQKAELATTLGLPIFVTEWGVGEANGNGKFDLEKTEKWLNWMEQHQLSWANWSLTDKVETTALLNPGASIKGNWTPRNLSRAGAYIRTKLRKLNIL